MQITTIILAAGKGTRMRSELPKVMHKIAGKSLLEHVYQTSKQIPGNAIKVVIGHGADFIREKLSYLDVCWVEQLEQLGTGHAVQQAAGQIGDDDIVLVVYGDVPLLKFSTLQNLLGLSSQESLALLTVNLDNPTGYGRIIRDENGRVQKIVEQKDATPSELAITEVNTGIMAVNGQKLKKWLAQLGNNNAQGEYYLTDVVAMAAIDGVLVSTCQPQTGNEVLGVNNRLQLSGLERLFQQGQAEMLMEQGVTLRDPLRFDLRGTITQLGQDIEIDVNVILEGEIKLGNNVSIGANTQIKNAVIGDNVEIFANCVIEDAVVGANSRIGPFARLRPGTVLAKEAHIGNFVELKNAIVAENSKINHLSYIGDANVGSHVNIGAGTITCNYDGVNKSRTVIGDGAFIGSSSQLVAPVTVGANATIGAGSTITKDCPDNQLTLARSKQVTLSGWQRPVKKDA